MKTAILTPLNVEFSILLLDENLSDKIIPKIIDLYPNSTHVKTLSLINTEDDVIWEYAK